MTDASQSNLVGMQLLRNAHGRLVLTLANGTVFEAVTPVRAFPIDAPLEGLSLIAADGKEALWVPRMVDLQPEHRQLIEQDLAVREFVPTIEEILKVSSFSTPSTWDLRTDRGTTQMVLKGEEDIRKLAGRTKLQITGQDGVQYRIPDSNKLDRHSRKLLERFL
ncbi:DUF1854 domain-containing protein [Comamonas sp. Y33R10-2]|uniref:cyanophycin metabolism-associated DUF1854 family protein n=1 Tax=Comamonas sp. Y33R10-2 TaxID=2853257 RepID=UPI001C5C8C1D|nr:DUF1854 domain-containing protein [Comamonas sp. Y33R10-2]QXZ09817.1 DUF1854 domain-containing protein [Comamonas sp. Y33R10-2]